MATVKDRAVAEPTPWEARQASVLNWLSDAPRPDKKDTEIGEVTTRLADILDELQGDNGHAAMKIRLR